MNRELAQSPRAAALAQGLEGRSLQIDAGSLLSLRATIAAGRLMLTGGAASEVAAADASIVGSPLALLSLFNGSAANPSGANSVQISGDAEVANRFRALFKCLKPDIEEMAARLIGDVPAHGLARFSAAAIGWARDALDTGRRNVAEYLVEESRDLVNRTEMDEFLRGVDLVRESADRIEARLTLLERRRGVGP